jgi:16S rRNA (guanine527-N7)-methyltransferase
VNRDLLSRSAAACGLLLSDAQLDAFTVLTKELQRWNRQINLTAIETDDEITIKHLVDSLQLAPLLEQGMRLLDIGSGGGFPALPLSLVRTDLVITSIDAVAKKISFQKHMCRLLNISGIEAVHGRVEQLGKTSPGVYDVVTSRAFSNLPQLLGLASPLLCEQGVVIAMRGAEKEAELQEHYRSIEKAGFVFEKVVRYDLPMKMGERCLIIARKSSFYG